MPNDFPPQFPLAELIRSERAQRTGISNVPDATHQQALFNLAWKILHPLRQAMGGPIKVTSGYRSPKLNAATPGSSATSQHSKGEAADIVSAGKFTNAEMFHWLRKNAPFDQLIWEYGTKDNPQWVHVSYRPNPMGKVLVTTGTPAKPSYASWR